MPDKRDLSGAHKGVIIIKDGGQGTIRAIECFGGICIVDDTYTYEGEGDVEQKCDFELDDETGEVFNVVSCDIVEHDDRNKGVIVLHNSTSGAGAIRAFKCHSGNEPDCSFDDKYNYDSSEAPSGASVGLHCAFKIDETTNKAIEIEVDGQEPFCEG